MDTTNHNKGQGLQEGRELQVDGKGLEGIKTKVIKYRDGYILIKKGGKYDPNDLQAKFQAWDDLKKLGYL